MSDDVRINGKIHSWGSITLKIGEERFTGITAISYGDSRERVKAYGMGRAQGPRGRTRGKYTTDPVVLTCHKSTAQLIRQKLADEGGGDSYGETEAQIVVEYFEENDEPITVEIEDCVYSKSTSSEQEGPDPLTEDIEFDPMFIRRNGLTLFDADAA